jgi:hypothetical protein
MVILKTNPAIAASIENTIENVTLRNAAVWNDASGRNDLGLLTVPPSTSSGRYASRFISYFYPSTGVVPKK